MHPIINCHVFNTRIPQQRWLDNKKERRAAAGIVSVVDHRLPAGPHIFEVATVLLIVSDVVANAWSES